MALEYLQAGFSAPLTRRKFKEEVLKIVTREARGAQEGSKQAAISPASVVPNQSPQRVPQGQTDRSLQFAQTKIALQGPLRVETSAFYLKKRESVRRIRKI